MGRRIGEEPGSRAAMHRRAMLGGLAAAVAARSRSSRGAAGGPRPQPRGRAYADPILARSDLESAAAALTGEPFAPDPFTDAVALRSALSEPTTAGFTFFIDGSTHFWTAKALGWTRGGHPQRPRGRRPAAAAEPRHPGM